MITAHPYTALVKADAIRTFTEVGWLDGTLMALRHRGVVVHRDALRRWVQEAGIEIRSSRCTGGRVATRSGDGRLLTQEEFDRAHEAYPVPECIPIGQAS